MMPEPGFRLNPSQNASRRWPTGPGPSHWAAPGGLNPGRSGLKLLDGARARGRRSAGGKCRTGSGTPTWIRTIIRVNPRPREGQREGGRSRRARDLCADVHPTGPGPDSGRVRHVAPLSRCGTSRGCARRSSAARVTKPRLP